MEGDDCAAVSQEMHPAHALDRELRACKLRVVTLEEENSALSETVSAQDMKIKKLVEDLALSEKRYQQLVENNNIISAKLLAMAKECIREREQLRCTNFCFKRLS